MDAYKVLNVPVTATPQQIHAAYRALARRWHPDRFPEGPERDWAGEHMAQINEAYRMCAKDPAGAALRRDDRAVLAGIEQLIGEGRYDRARSELMRVSTRCAEWNYLFGAVLLKLCEREKALIYLGVAARQQPGNEKYAAALRAARGNTASHGLLRDLFGGRSK